ncbi:MAG: tRNA (5-methylaminomethyl-2-thiouridylate)-methyltransferase [Chloroflexota bacterium]
MLLEGIGEAIEQSFPLMAVVGLSFAEQWQPFVRPELVKPARLPGSALEDPVEVSPNNVRRDPAQARLIPLLESESDRAADRPHRCRLEFAEEQFSITPGQAAVFYAGKMVLGGGLIQA